MATYILIHGAWHGAWCWEKVIPLLEEKGHAVYALDLPGHGHDKTPLAKINLQSYLDCIEPFILQAKEPVILVGHSMAGIIISQAAEYWPQKIAALIYVAAFIPQNGEFLSQIVQKQPHTESSKKIRAIFEKSALVFPLELMYEFAYQKCERAWFETIRNRFCIEPLRPFLDKIQITQERFGSVPRIYVNCVNDQAVWHASQMRMVNETPCDVYALECDHSPFYSDPKGLVTIFSTV